METRHQDGNYGKPQEKQISVLPFVYRGWFTRYMESCGGKIQKKKKQLLRVSFCFIPTLARDNQCLSPDSGEGIFKSKLWQYMNLLRRAKK